MSKLRRMTIVLGLAAASTSVAHPQAASAPTSAAASAPVERLPNICIFLIDTLRADRLSVYGYERPTSPNLEQLARESIVFERCYAPASWTLPSVASLFSSTYPCEHGVVREGQRLSESLPTLPALLAPLGYFRAGCTANVFVGPATGLERGFSRMQSHPMADGGIIREWLPNLRGRPAFFYLHNIEPHDPHLRMFAPDRHVTALGAPVTREQRRQMRELLAEYRRLGRADHAASQPRGTTDNTAEQQAVMARLEPLRPLYEQLYDAAVRTADENIGSVVDTLKQTGLWDNSIFVVVSDHGEEFGERGEWLHGQSLYNELLHVPLIVRLPGRRFGGRRVAAPVALVDVVPTLLELIGAADRAEGCRGLSLVPLMRGEPPAPGPRPAAVRVNTKKFYRPNFEQRGDLNVASFDGMWKGIWNAGPQRFELYDLSRDPREQHDLAGSAPEAAALEAFTRRWFDDCLQRAPAVPVQALDEDTLRQLEALGYVDQPKRE